MNIPNNREQYFTVVDSDMEINTQATFLKPPEKFYQDFFITKP